MFRFLASFLTLKLVDRVSAEAERARQEMLVTVRKAGFGLLALKVSSSLLLIAVLLLLFSLFLHLSDLPRFVMPLVWTGLVSAGGALLGIITAGTLMRH